MTDEVSVSEWVEDSNCLFARDGAIPPVIAMSPDAGRVADAIARRQVMNGNATERRPDIPTRQSPPDPAQSPSLDRIENTEIVHRKAG